MTEKQATYATIHPACPPKLQRAYKRARWNMRTLARNCGINIYYASRAIRYGERPANENIAKALFFTREYKHRTGQEPKPEPPAHIKWWRSMSKEEREGWIRSGYEIERARTRNY